MSPVTSRFYIQSSSLSFNFTSWSCLVCYLSFFSFSFFLLFFLSFLTHFPYLPPSPVFSLSNNCFLLLFCSNFSSHHRPLNIGQSQGSLFQITLFSVYIYSLGGLNKSHVLKTLVMLLIANSYVPEIFP